MPQDREIEFVVPLRPHRYELVLAFEVETLSELSVGGSAVDVMLGSGTTDNPIAKTITIVKYRDKEIAEIIPYIPASTLKGLMRSHAEDIARNEGKRLTLQELLKGTGKLEASLDTQTLNEIMDKLVSRILKQYLDENLVNMIVNRIRGRERFAEFAQTLDNIENLSKFLAGLARDEEERELFSNLAHPIYVIAKTYNIYTRTCNPVVEGLVCELPLPKYKLLLLKTLARSTGEHLEYPCKVCRLFGLPGYMSRLIVTDAWPTNVKELLILSRTHIAIDRLKGSVVHGKTFDIEYLAPHAKLVFLTIYHLATRENLEEKITGETTNPNNCLEAINLLKEKIEDPIDMENLELLGKLIQSIKTVQIGKRKTWGMGEANIGCKALALQDTYTKRQILKQGEINLAREGVPIPLLKLIEIYNLSSQSNQGVRR